ncbi:MAG: DUF342 domain-containing protein [Burkholderiales bacterium]|nr:DUF342 domain-containing protein [Burkholderiales bacterium]
MAIESPVSGQVHVTHSGKTGNGPGVDHSIIKRADGVFVDPSLLGATFQAAVSNLFASNSFFVGVDYPVFIKALYVYDQDQPRAQGGEAPIRFAADIASFDTERRALYKSIKVSRGKAEYYFEPVYLPGQSQPGATAAPARLDFDEFVADMWGKGLRFGIDAAAVRNAIESGNAGRVVVAQQLDPVPGVDAHIVEVASDLRRSDAPRLLAGGRLDLMSFQNRFPQIKKGVRLLKKVARKDGVPGFELSGLVLMPPLPSDLDLGQMAGPGTAIENSAEGEFLVAQLSGFLNADDKTHQLSVGDKIVSREGVSVRTTGNLQLAGDYEEFGEVQEKRVIEGGNITVHADVFGNIVSRGGAITLNGNLVGGTATNAAGNIELKGVASGAVLQTRDGEITMARADNCIISGSRVVIEHAANCEIIADEVVIVRAEGCAVAARKILIESAGPRKQSEMLVFALLPDSSKIDKQIEEFNARVSESAAAMDKLRLEMDALTQLPEVRSYLMLAGKINKKELTLTPAQEPQFRKMALAAGPTLKAIGKVALDLKKMDESRQAVLQMVAALLEQKNAASGSAHVTVNIIEGDTTVRVMKFDPDGSRPYDLASKDIKSRLRGLSNDEKLFAASCGSFDWACGQ